MSPEEETIMNNNMTQDERWNIRYNEVKAFIETNHRNPSRHRIEEHDMLNWVKAESPCGWNHGNAETRIHGKPAGGNTSSME